MAVVQRVWCLADPGPMHKCPEELKVEFYPVVSWSHTRSWNRYKPGNSKTKIYLWSVHQQTCQTRLWLPREGLVHQTGAWLSDEGGLLRVGYLAAVFVGDNITCPEANMVKGYFQRAQPTPQKLLVAACDFCHITSRHFSFTTKTYVGCLHVVNCRCSGEEEKFISNLHVETFHVAWTYFLFKLNIYLCTLKKCWF